LYSSKKQLLRRRSHRCPLLEESERTEEENQRAAPLIGALGGAAVNYAFIDHFQEIARAHFTVRRLELRYPAEFMSFGDLELLCNATSRLDRRPSRYRDCRALSPEPPRQRNPSQQR
jgi:EcsC protein family